MTMDDPRQGPSALDVARGSEAYARYGVAVGWKTYSGAPMPPWFDLGPTVQGGWIAVGRMQSDAIARETSVVPPLVAVLIDEYEQRGMPPNRLAELIRALREVYGYGA